MINISSRTVEYIFWSVLAFPALASALVGVEIGTLALGCMVELAPLLQMRLMDISRDGQSLVAASNHAALNVANAVGPCLGGWVISAGWDWTSPGYIGAELAVGGVSVSAISILLGVSLS